jgi:hypothetical protein
MVARKCAIIELHGVGVARDGAAAPSPLNARVEASQVEGGDKNAERMNASAGGRIERVGSLELGVGSRESGVPKGVPARRVASAGRPDTLPSMETPSITAALIERCQQYGHTAAIAHR